MRCAPVRALAIDEAAAREEFENVVARFQNLSLEGLATSHDVAHPLLRLGGDADRRELAGAIEPRQVGRITLVVLPLDARTLRNERRRDHLTRVAPLAERAMKDIARATRFIATSQLALAREATEIAFELR